MSLRPKRRPLSSFMFSPPWDGDSVICEKAFAILIADGWSDSQPTKFGLKRGPARNRVTDCDPRSQAQNFRF